MPSAAAVKRQSEDLVQPVAKRTKGYDAEVASRPGALRQKTKDIDIGEGLKIPRMLWESLYKYQQEGVRWLWRLHNEGAGGILADEMGLGKTVQVAAYLQALHHSKILQKMTVAPHAGEQPSRGGVLILCPRTLVNQWEGEFKKWCPALPVAALQGLSHGGNVNSTDAADAKDSAAWAPGQNHEDFLAMLRRKSHDGCVTITSYETVRMLKKEMASVPWVIVVLDEGDRIRNPNSDTTISVKQFATPHRILLTGSPIQNNLQDLWSLTDFVRPGSLGTLPVFMENLVRPIENAGAVDANPARVEAAYHCAVAVRDLTMPCVLRRSKADVMDSVRLPHKQEEVLFCNLTPEQYQMYVEFLQTHWVRQSLDSRDAQENNGSTKAIATMRKLCNHADIVLPTGQYHINRSGKMLVLSQILRVWHHDKHRVLIFVQMIEMLDIIQQWCEQQKYSYLRLDGKVEVDNRLELINKFNTDPNIFAMILTKRVGGTGLNITGANRVVIFEPDWNPTTSVRARERAWRIGQEREVAVYRLILAGTIEEKIYRREVFKQTISQKVLDEPGQEQFFRKSDLADLFELPVPPPDFNPLRMRQLKDKCKMVFKEMVSTGVKRETTEALEPFSNVPLDAAHTTGKGTKTEHEHILQKLQDSHGLRSSFNHDKVDQPIVLRKDLHQTASRIASAALGAVKRSARECASHHRSTPTWTGQVGLAGASLASRRASGTAADDRITRSAMDPQKSSNSGAPVFRRAEASAGVRDGDGATKSEDDPWIVECLKKLSKMKHHEARQRLAQAAAAAAGADGTVAAAAGESPGRPLGRPVMVHGSEREIATMILNTFLDIDLAGPRHCLTTGQVLEHLGPQVPPKQRDLFKTCLQQVCTLSQATRRSEPGVWSLRLNFWPVSSRAGFSAASADG